MKFMASVRKSFIENIRDWKVLCLVIAFSPFFIVLMYASYGGTATSYNISIVNYDEGILSQNLINGIQEMKNPDDSNLINVNLSVDEETLKTLVTEKVMDIGIVIPSNYSEGLKEKIISEETPSVQLYGSLGNVKYTIAAIFVGGEVYNQGMKVQEIALPTYFEETFLEERLPLNEFEGMVPGLMALAVLMIMFS
jgi:ABC-2 type transport system permease protein